MEAMSVATSLRIVEFVVLGGLASYMTLSALNNVVAFRGGVGAIGHLMSMELLRQPPTNDSPLLSRAVKGPGWHRAVFGLTVLLEIVCALLLWWAVVMIAAAACGPVDGASALKVVNISLAALLALLFFFMLGGTWFAYYMRQEELVISHEAMIGLTIAAAVLSNVAGG